MPGISCIVLSFVCCCLVCQCLECSVARNGVLKHQSGIRLYLDDKEFEYFWFKLSVFGP